MSVRMRSKFGCKGAYWCFVNAAYVGLRAEESQVRGAPPVYSGRPIAGCGSRLSTFLCIEREENSRKMLIRYFFPGFSGPAGILSP